MISTKEERVRRLSEADIIYSVVLALASLITYIFIYDFFQPSINRPHDMVGAIWATVATIFVFKDASSQSIHAGIVRFFATCISFVLTLIYFLLFPFTPIGMAVVIALGTLLAILLGQREDIITTGITTSVIMIVGGIVPTNQAWLVPILRLIDTIIGIVIGISCWWLNYWLQTWTHSYFLKRRTSTALHNQDE